MSKKKRFQEDDVRQTLKSLYKDMDVSDDDDDDDEAEAKKEAEDDEEEDEYAIAVGLNSSRKKRKREEEENLENFKKARKEKNANREVDYEQLPLSERMEMMPMYKELQIFINGVCSGKSQAFDQRWTASALKHHLTNPIKSEQKFSRVFLDLLSPYYRKHLNKSYGSIESYINSFVSYNRGRPQARKKFSFTLMQKWKLIQVEKTATLLSDIMKFHVLNEFVFTRGGHKRGYNSLETEAVDAVEAIGDSYLQRYAAASF